MAGSSSATATACTTSCRSTTVLCTTTTTLRTSRDCVRRLAGFVTLHLPKVSSELVQWLHQEWWSCLSGLADEWRSQSVADEGVSRLAYALTGRHRLATDEATVVTVVHCFDQLEFSQMSGWHKGFVSLHGMCCDRASWR